MREGWVGRRLQGPVPHGRSGWGTLSARLGPLQKEGVAPDFRAPI